MTTLTNVQLNANLYNPVVFFDLDGTTYAIFTDGPEKVLTGDMDGICEVLSSQMEMKKNWDDASTTYKFNDFHIVSNCSGATGMLN